MLIKMRHKNKKPQKYWRNIFQMGVRRQEAIANSSITQLFRYRFFSVFFFSSSMKFSDNSAFQFFSIEFRIFFNRTQNKCALILIWKSRAWQRQHKTRSVAHVFYFLICVRATTMAINNQLAKECHKYLCKWLHSPLHRWPDPAVNEMIFNFLQSTPGSRSVCLFYLDSRI